MKEKIFFAFNLDDARSQRGGSEHRVSLRLVAAANRGQAQAILAELSGGGAWAVISRRDIYKALIQA